MTSQSHPASLRRLRVALALAMLATSVLFGTSCPPRATRYTLLPESTFSRGCFGPCLCPVQIAEALQGTFLLVEVTPSPAAPFRDFDVRDVHWLATLADQTLTITGSGHYRVGGEVALTQQLVLDLQENGGPVQHFDSGIVPGGGSFPLIDVEIGVADAVCFNTFIHVVAKPLGSTP
jgi:hypothetical protein